MPDVSRFRTNANIRFYLDRMSHIIAALILADLKEIFVIRGKKGGGNPSSSPNFRSKHSEFIEIDKEFDKFLQKWDRNPICAGSIITV